MNTRNTTTVTDTRKQEVSAHQAAEIYRSKGYSRPIPMREEDAKLPLLRGVHGQKVSTGEANATALEWWENNQDANVNLALVLATNSDDFEIISIDVDHHDDKRGRDHLEALEEEYGSLGLNKHPARSTRRGASDKGGQFFFRVTKNQWWPARACEDVDIRWLGNSYSAVWPSVKDGQQYQWLNPDGEETEIPNVADLPELPTQWVEALSRGDLPKGFNRIADAVEGLDDAYERLHGLVAKFDAPITEPLTHKVKAVDLSSAHSGMNAGVHSLIQWCAFEGGPVGLRAALELLQQRYLTAVSDRRSEPVAKAEFARSVEGEVALVLADVAQGKKLSITAVDAIAHQLKGFDLTSKLGASELASAHEELLEKVKAIVLTSLGDDLPARLLLLLTNDLRAVDQDLHNRAEAELYDTKKGVHLTKATLRPYFRQMVIPVLNMYKSTLNPEDKDLDWLVKKVNGAINYCSTQGSMNGALPTLVGLLSEAGLVLKESDFDKDDHLRGLSDGMVLDLNKWVEGDLRGSVRPREPEELLKMSMNISGSEILQGCDRLDKGEKAPVMDLAKAIFNPELLPMIYELMAYSIHGNNPHRLIWGVIGETGTGKSTWLDFYSRILGDYGSQSTLEDLSSRGGNNSSKAAAMRASVAFISELSQDTKGQRDALKEISGNEMVAVTDKFTRTEYHRGSVICFSTNEAARIDFDEALEDRFVVVPTADTRSRLEATLTTMSPKGSSYIWQDDPINIVALLDQLAKSFARPWREGFKQGAIHSLAVETAKKFVAASNPLNAFFEEELLFTGDDSDRLAQVDLIEAIKDSLGDEAVPKVPELSRVMIKHGALGKKKSRAVGVSVDSRNVARFLGVKFSQKLDIKVPVEAAA